MSTAPIQPASPPETARSSFGSQVQLHRPKIGLLAGWGRFPLTVAAALKRQGCHVCGLGIKDHADPALAAACDDFAWVGLSKLGHAIRYFRRHGVREATMAGKVHKIRLFQASAWIKLWPDWRTFWTLWPHFLAGRHDRRDDTLLGAITDCFDQAGIHFAPATDYAPELLVKAGTLTRRGPSTAQWADIRFAWKLAKELGRLDVGQSVAVRGLPVRWLLKRSKGPTKMHPPRPAHPLPDGRLPPW